jgi:ankyrin repeat protein
MRLWESTWDCVVRTDRVEIAEMYLPYNAVVVKEDEKRKAYTRLRIDIYDLFIRTVQHGSLAIMQLLLADPGVQERISRDDNLIHEATTRHNPKVLQVLLDSNDIRSNSVIRRNQRTALHSVAARGLLSVADVLLSSGTVNASRTDSRGQAPLHRAAASGRLGMVRLLLGHQGVTQQAHIEDLKHLHADTVKLLLEHSRIDITTRTRTRTRDLVYMDSTYFLGDESAVELARKRGHMEIHSLLMAAGAVDTLAQ